jgi:hypothetical protein
METINKAVCIIVALATLCLFFPILAGYIGVAVFFISFSLLTKWADDRINMNKSVWKFSALTWLMPAIFGASIAVTWVYIYLAKNIMKLF